jgi:hypothetical protein
MKYYTADGTGAILLRCKQVNAGATSAPIAAEEIAVHAVRLHLNAASAAEDFVTSIDSGINSRYDAVLDTKAMNALLDYSWQPTRPHYLRGDDDLVITKTNAAGLSWSVVVIYDSI